MWLMVCTSQLLVFRSHEEKVFEVAECTLGLELPVALACFPQCNSGEFIWWSYKGNNAGLVWKSQLF